MPSEEYSDVTVMVGWVGTVVGKERGGGRGVEG